MMRKTAVLILSVFWVFYVEGCGNAIDGGGRDSSLPAGYYVAPAGNDSNPGTAASPWLTIQKAANTLAAGDTVYIRAGTYKERIVPKNSGNANNYIVYAAYPGELVTVEGSGVTVSTNEGLFDLSGRSYIKVSGLRVINSKDAGIYANNADHLLIEKNYTYNSVSSGIGIWNSNNIITATNEVVLACNDGEQECITVAITSTFEIYSNAVHNGGPGTNGGEGICLKDGSVHGRVYKNLVYNIPGRVGIYVDAWDKHTYDIEVFGNIVHDIIGDGFNTASEAGGLLENIKFYNNLSYNNKFCGLTVARNGTASKHPAKNINIINNTFYNNGISWGGGIAVDDPDAEDLIIRNNICSQDRSFEISVAKGLSLNNITIENNLLYSYKSDSADGEVRGNNYVESDPLFINAGQFDFHLQQNSPAIDRGSAVLAPIIDFDGIPRPQGSGFAIGAFEFK